MWCHLCKLNFTDYEDFKCHVMDKHKSSADFYKDDSESEESDGNSIEIPDDFQMESADEDSHEIKIVEVTHIEMNKEELDSDEIADSEGSGESSNSTQNNTPTKSHRSGYSLRKRKPSKLKSKKKHLPKKYSKKISAESDDSTDTDKVSSGTNENAEPAKSNQYPTVNPLVGQGFTYAMNPLYSDVSLLSDGGFEMNSENILKWFAEHKELCKELKYPLHMSLYNKIKSAKHTIFDLYYRAPANEASSAVLKVYENLTSMIIKHIASVNEELSLSRS